MSSERWQQIEALYRAARERKPEDRSAFVDGAAGDDADLRQQVEGLLQQDSAGPTQDPLAQTVATQTLVVQTQSTQTIVGKGSQLGPYKIEALIGAGGMGEVFRATDTRLRRTVAIKILPRDKVADPDRKKRFLQEARAASALNHPNIVTVYDIASDSGVDYLVMEYVPGRSLDKLIASKGLPVAEALGYAAQIADALATAHAAGIVHRDIKPANVMVTQESQVKILDFGLAKLTERAPSPESETLTVESALTEAGTVVGTVAYMSPEQASARPLDHRTDIFSLGIVLYEMLAGRRPFRGTSHVETMYAIIHDPTPPLAQPFELADIVDKALAKDPKDRYQHAGDLALDLRRFQQRPARAREEMPHEVPLPQRRRWHWTVLAALLALGVGIMGEYWWLGRGAVAQRRISIERLTDFRGMEEQPAVSPDAKILAFIFPVNGRRQLWVRPLAGEGSAPIQVTHDDADHQHPRWTPDSSSLVYYSEAPKEGNPGQLWIVSYLGNAPPRAIASSQGEGDISRDGRIATFQTQGDRTVMAILAPDGSAAESAKALDQTFLYSVPRWSPNGRWIAFKRASPQTTSSGFICIMDARTGDVAQLGTDTGLQGLAWSSDNSTLIYASAEGSTSAYPPLFQLRAVSRDGSHDRQLTFDENSYVDPDIDSSGRVFASRIRRQSDILKFPVTGSPRDNVANAEQITSQTGQVQTPSVSPDGTLITYLSDSGGHVNVWVARVDGADARQVTHERDPAVAVGVPVWHPSGDRIVYVQFRAGISSQWLINADGSGQRRQLGPLGAVAAAWSANGQWFYYMVTEQNGYCIKKIPADGGEARNLQCNAGAPVISRNSMIYFAPGDSAKGEIRKARTDDAPSEHFASFDPARRIPGVPHNYSLSPDDKWLAAQFMDAGTTNVWAWPTDGGSIRQLTDFGHRPILITRRVGWSQDSKSIYAAVLETDADVVSFSGLLQ